MESDMYTKVGTLRSAKEMFQRRNTLPYDIDAHCTNTIQKMEDQTRPVGSLCSIMTGQGTKHTPIPVPIPTIEAIKLSSTLPRAKSDKSDKSDMLASMAPPRLPKPYQKMALCGMCGQFHDETASHLYDYPQPVDEDLVCHICLQPLVHPLDTKCGHTFCGRCIENHLDVQKLCPIDRLALNVKELTPSSLVIRKLLDKLLVVCPNVDYCEEVLPRCDLQAHLANRCRGAITKCVKSDVGCKFQGPRSALQSHLWECPFRDVDSGTGSLPRLPVLEGEITTIDIQRGCYDLGISVVGGCDTPLICVVIQEIFPDGVVAKDSRLQPGDQVLEVNGIDLTQVSHREARQALKQVYPICRLTVYREKAEDQSTEKEEILKISLPKIPGKQLGIKLVGKKNGAGLYILEMIGGGLAAADNRLKKDDRILEINCQDMTFGTQEQASQIILASVDKVQIVVARKARPQTPDIVRSTSRDCLTNCVRKECILGYMPYKCKEKIITIQKDAAETLGISVAGGVGSPRGDIPIYVTNVQSTGCLARSRQVKKGDVLLTINGRSLLDLTHTDAVGVLKAAAEARQVVLKVLEGPETTEGMGNFTPSWKFWLAMPVVCHTTRTVTLERAATGTLGFSIVGGSDAAQGPQPIYIKSIVPNTPAGKDARLRSGDLLLSVNNHSLENVTHTQAVILLKNSRGDVTLRVVSWPGTVV